MTLANVALVIAHSSVLETATAAAFLTGLSTDRILIIDDRQVKAGPNNMPNVSALISLGERAVMTYEELSLRPGEGRKKIALLAWSSGTTGNPKVGYIGDQLANTKCQHMMADLLLFRQLRSRTRRSLQISFRWQLIMKLTNYRPSIIHADSVREIQFWLVRQLFAMDFRVLRCTHCGGGDPVLPFFRK